MDKGGARRRSGSAAAALGLVLWAAAAAWAQTPATSATRSPSFAPGVLTAIPPELNRDDALSFHDVVELRASEKLKWQPQAGEPPVGTATRTLYEMAHDAAFPQRVWCLELTIKPLRMIDADVVDRAGRRSRQPIWYLVYRVRNTGAAIEPIVAEDGQFDTQPAESGEVRFLPQFVLASHDREKSGEPIRKAYLDRLVPAAMGAIRSREFDGGELYDSVSMSQTPLPVESGRAQRGRWGVAMWAGVDPTIDFFSVYVGGLTNAYQWTDPSGAYRAGDPPGTGRKIARKTLQLNFWRPGDEIEQNEREIRLGPAPGKADLYGVSEGVAWQWVYR